MERPGVDGDADTRLLQRTGKLNRRGLAAQIDDGLVPRQLVLDGITDGIFLTRFLPGVRAAVMPFAGVVALPPERALPPAFLASALWYAGLIVVGSALGLRWEAIRSLVIGANRALGVVALIATALFALWLARRLRR